MLAFFRICRYNLYCALRRRIEVVITGLTRNQVASRGLEGSNPSVSASATGNTGKGVALFICSLRRRRRRARAPARARAARDWATLLLHSYTLCVPTIAERRIPPSIQSQQAMLSSVAFFIPLRRRRRRARAPARARAARDWADGLMFLTYFCCRQSLKGESLRPYSHSRQCFQALPFFI